MRSWARALLLAAAVGCDGTDGDVLTPRGPDVTAKLIAHGHDMPVGADDLAELHARLSAAEAMPFDGMVVDLGMSRNVVGSTPLVRARLQPALDQLRAIPFRKLTDNFQQLALTASPDLDWWNDATFAVAVANMGVAAGLVREAGLRGFYVDNQVYGSRLWSYPDQPAGHSFADAQAKVAARGEALIGAALDAFPAAIFLLAFGYSELLRMVCVDGQPLERHLFGLYPAFLDGMLRAVAARKATGTIIDVYLPAYPTKDPGDFAVFYNLIHFRWERLMSLWHPGIVTHWDAAPAGQKRQSWRAAPQLVCDAPTLARLGRDLPAGFGLMVDYGEGAPFHADAAGFADNYFTPDALEAALTGALRATDRYVWLWQESWNWWGPRRNGAPAAPAAYLEAVAHARQKARRSGP